MTVMDPTDWRTWAVSQPAVDPDPVTGSTDPLGPLDQLGPLMPLEPVARAGLALRNDGDDRSYPLNLARQRALLREWAGRAYLSQLEHSVAAGGYSRLNRIFGVPAVAATTFVGTAVVTSLVESGLLVTWTKVTIAVVALIGATLTALQTFFNHGLASSAHQKFWAEYECILRRVDMLRSELPNGTHIAPIEAESAARYLRGRLKELEEHIERIDRTAPVIPARYLRAAQRRADLRRVQGYEPVVT